jgi:hypothetical protein
MTRRRPDVPMERVAAEAIEMVVAAEELGAVAALSIKNHEVVGASNTGGGVRRADALRLEQEELKRGETRSAGFVCLPDTVDPRAPKAK